MIELTGKWALVTGSARGIGRACALRLAEAGANIVVNYVTSQKAATETAEEIAALGRQVIVVKADVSVAEDIQEMVDFIGQQVDQLDILVSNAASGGFRWLMNSTPRHFELAMNTNVLALISLVKAALPLLEKCEGHAKVVAISSHGAEMALPMYGLIGGSKAALESIVRHLAMEIGRKRINVNIVRAGLVETDSTRMLPGSREMFAGRSNKSLIGDRELTAEDIANAVLYLCAPMSDLVQGSTITIDGGAGIHP